MATEPVDYAVVLADLEAKRDALNKAIDGLRSWLRLESPRVIESANHAGSSNTDIPSDAFFNMRIPDAIFKYLSIVKGKQSVKQIADALDQGGLKSLAKDAYNNIYTTLMRMSKSPEPIVVRVGADWALTEWYPRSPRRANSVDSAAKPDETKGNADLSVEQGEHKFESNL